MAGKKTIFDLQQAVNETYQTVMLYLGESLPQIVGAIAILLIGLVVAYLLRLAVRKLTLGAENLLLRSAEKRGLKDPGRRSYSALIGNLAFWSVLLFFMAASANVLDWQIFSKFLGGLLTYLPQLFSGLLIILAGIVLGGVVRSLIESTASSTGMPRAELPARIAQAAVVITAIVVGIDQLGIDITFLTTSFIVIAGVLLFGAALSFGLGAKDYIANLIGARLSQHHFQVGQKVRLDDTEGLLLEITQTALVLDTERGRIVVPASLLQQRVCEIVTEDSAGAESTSAGQERNQEHKNGDA